MKMFRTADGAPKWWLSAMLIVALTPLFAGCYGSFRVTKALHKFNGNVTENSVVNQVIFWIIAPAYGFTAFVDVLVVNTMEFWSGEKVTTAMTAEDGTDYVMESNGDGKSVTVTVTRPDEAPTQLTYTRVGEDQLQVTDAQGNLLRTVTR